MKGVSGSKVASIRCRRSPGFSVAEVLVVIAVIGILATLALRSIPQVLGSSKSTVARNLVETLNTGVHRFNQTNYELLLTAVPASGADELSVLRTLQYRDPDTPAIGSPYMRN